MDVGRAGIGMTEGAGGAWTPGVYMAYCGKKLAWAEKNAAGNTMQRSV
jgi:hypothetical protein